LDFLGERITTFSQMFGKTACISYKVRTSCIYKKIFIYKYSEENQVQVERFSGASFRENYLAIQAFTKAVSCILVPLPVGVSVRTMAVVSNVIIVSPHCYSPYVESKEPAAHPKYPR